MNPKESLGWTPFMYACPKGYKDVVKPLQKPFLVISTTSLCPFGQAYIKGVHPKLSLEFISMSCPKNCPLFLLCIG